MASICITGLAKDTTNQSLENYFAYYGTVTKAEVKLDPRSGQSLRIGHVEFANQKSAKKALADAEIHLLDDRAIEVAEVPEAKDADEAGLEEEVAIECEDNDLICAPTKATKATKRHHAEEADETEHAKKKSKRGDSASACIDEPHHEITGDGVNVQESGLSETSASKQVYIGGLSKETGPESLYGYLSYYGELEEIELKVEKTTGKSRGFAFATFEDPVSVEVCIAEDGHVIDGKQVRIRHARRDEQIMINQDNSGLQKQVKRKSKKKKKQGAKSMEVDKTKEGCRNRTKSKKQKKKAKKQAATGKGKGKGKGKVAGKGKAQKSLEGAWPSECEWGVEWAKGFLTALELSQGW